MKIKANKNTICFTCTLEKDDRILFNSEWLSDGHVLISRKVNILTVKGMTDAQSKLWFSSASYSERGHDEKEISAAFERVTDQYVDTLPTVTATKLVYQGDRWPSRYLWNEESQKVTAVSEQYFSLTADRDLYNKDNLSPVFVVHSAVLSSVIMSISQGEAANELRIFKRMTFNVVFSGPQSWENWLSGKTDIIPDNIVELMEQLHVTREQYHGVQGSCRGTNDYLFKV